MQTIIFDVVAPLVIVGINACGVFVSCSEYQRLKTQLDKLQTYGVIESMFGVLKLFVVLGCCLLMFGISAMGTSLDMNKYTDSMLTIK